MNITRRTMLAGTAVAAAGAILMPRSWAAEGKAGGDMTHLVPVDPPTFDLHATQTSFVAETVSPCYSTLLRFEPKTYPEIVGDIAKSWDVSDDGLVYTFHLNEGVKFHDGSDLTADDIKASWERIKNPPQGVVSVRQSELGDIDKIEVLDPHTIRFTLKEVNVAMLTRFANPWHVIYSAKKLADNPNYPATEVMGSGPFKFVEYQKGSHFSVAKFDDYFVEGKPYLATIRANFVGGPALATALTAGQADAMFWFVTPQERQAISQVQGDNFVFDPAPMNSIVFATLSATAPAFSDQRVRMALNLAVDRYQANAALSKVSVLKGATAYFAPGSQYTSSPEELEKLPGYGKDIEASREKARQLLADAGAKNLKIKLQTRNLAPFETPTVYFIDQWRRIGVEVEVIKLDTPAYFAALQNHTFDAIVEAYNFNSMDPNEVFQKFLPGSSVSYAGNTDEELTSMFDQLKREKDQKARVDLAHKYQARLLDQSYYLPLLWNERVTVRRKTLAGWYNTPVFAVGADYRDLRFES